MNVIIIEDSALSTFVLHQHLKSLLPLAHVATFDSAVHALTYLTGNQNNSDLHPDLIFLDIKLPVMDAFKFLEEYGKLDAMLVSQAKIIVFTADIGRKVDEAKQHPLVSTVITKPLTRDKIFAAISEN